jgi:hypothetical protein
MRPPHFIIRFLSNRQQRRIKKLSKQIAFEQSRVFQDIIEYFKGTKLGAQYNLDKVHTIEDFNEVVPMTTDVDYQELLEEVIESNKKDSIEPGFLKYIGKTSGSTNKSKYIPYTAKLIKNFKRFSTNVVFQFCHINQRYDVFDENILVTPGNPVSEKNSQGITIGYASGIMTMLAPKFSRKIVKPSLDVMKLDTLDEKVKAMVKEALELDIRSFSSMPTFAIPVLEELFRQAREKGMEVETIKDIWPNFIMYIFSGSSVTPYEEKIKSYIGHDIPILEVYSATESPVAFQYGKKRGELYLDVESAFFQFQEVGSALDSKRLGVHEVEVGKVYRILMTTYGGLMCYRIGDIVEFTSLNPPLIKILGREKEELNIVGNERMPIPLVHKFVDEVLQKNDLKKDVFFICSYHNAQGKRGYHWCFEFDEKPNDIQKLLFDLDRDLRELNSNYDFSRNGNTRLIEPQLSLLPEGTISKYIVNNKQFGQGKFLSVHNTNKETDKFFEYLKDSGIQIDTYITEQE